MLVGRHREQQAIAEALAHARSSRSVALALRGEVGIGKSSLLDWAESQATGMRVLRARGVQSEAQIPFGGLFELLRPALSRIDELPAPQARALESALAMRPPAAHDRFSVGAATLTLLAAHAEAGPLLVVIDDAHWLDGSSGDALRFAVRRLVADPIAVLLSVRDDEPSLIDDTDIPVLDLGGLPAADIAVLLGRSQPHIDAEAARRLERETGGNPLALLELPPDAAEVDPLETPVPVPTRVAAAYVERIAGLTVPERAMLELAAASDRGEVAVLTRAAAQLGLELGDLAAAEGLGLLAVREGRAEFRHPLARAAIYREASEESRRRAHRALAEALPDADADRRAWHLALAAIGPDERAAGALEAAGARAQGRGAFQVASRAFERAAQLQSAEPDRGPLEYAAAECAWLGGDADRAEALLDSATGSGDDPGVALDVDRLRGHIATRRGPLGEATVILRAAAERAAEETAVVLLAEACQAAFLAGDPSGMIDAAGRAWELGAESSVARTAFFAHISQGMADIFAGDGEHGAELIRRAVDLLEASDELRSEPLLLAWASTGPLWLREAGGGGAGLIGRAVSAARAGAAAGVLPYLLLHVGIDQAATDRWTHAEATFDEAARLARESGQRTVLAGIVARGAEIDARCGREHACRRHAEEALGLAAAVGSRSFAVWAHSALGQLELARGDAGAAVGRFEMVEALLAEGGVTDADLSPAPELVELHLRERRADAAERAAGPFVEAAKAKGQPWAQARAWRCRGLLAADGSFETDFDAALELHARAGDSFETARTQLAFGSRLRRDGRRADARVPLRAAFETFDRLGAAPWADRAQTELSATGETARRRDPSTLDDLTPQELRVALLLTRGRTTREAAGELFLSPKTVEYHLRNAYRKTGTSSRAELGDLLDS